ncbi:MAG: hypothetical protein JWN15_4125 [Firmicutes bacterium]|nr:hypothetical protein [Bacillota bacterium]
MLLNLTEYHRPTILADAVHLLRAGAGRAAVLAGGTELVGRQDSELAAVIDLRGLGLAGLSPAATGLGIGAMTTLKELAALPAVGCLAGGILARAAQVSAPATIRAAATLGGTLAGCKGGEEIPTVLLALGARVALAEPELVEVPFATFLRDRDELLEAAIITSIIIPARAAEARGGFVRVTRTPADRAIVCAAAVVPVGGAATVAVGGVEAHPRQVDPAGEFATWEAVGDHRAGAEYRRRVAPVLVRRALAEAQAEAQAEAEAESDGGAEV